LENLLEYKIYIHIQRFENLSMLKKEKKREKNGKIGFINR